MISFSCKSLKTGVQKTGVQGWCSSTLQGDCLVIHVPSNFLFHHALVFALFHIVQDGSSSYLHSSQRKGKMVKHSPYKTYDFRSPLTGQNLITWPHLVQERLGKRALNSECIQPKFRGSTTEDKEGIGVYEPPEIIYRRLYKYLWICVLF